MTNCFDQKKWAIWSIRRGNTPFSAMTAIPVCSATSAHKYTGSWLIDFNALMRYQLFPFLDLHGGYQLIYLTDLALAPRANRQENLSCQ